MALVERIRPIRTEQQYEQYLRAIDELLGDKSEEAREELEVLSLLVEAYEEAHWPVPPPDPIEAIKFYMDMKGLKPKDMEVYLGSRQRVSEVLNRRRPLNLAMIRRLHVGLGIPAEVLIHHVVSAEQRGKPGGAAAGGNRTKAAGL